VSRFSGRYNSQDKQYNNKKQAIQSRQTTITIPPYHTKTTNTKSRDYDKNTTHHDKTTRRYDSNQIAKITQNQANSERGLVLATPVTPGIQIAKNAKNQAKSSQFRTRFSPFATAVVHHNMNMKHPNSKNKQNQANSERGFVLATAVVHLNLNLPNSKKTQKSSKIKPTPNEVLSSPRPSTITVKSERGSVYATPVTPGIQIAKNAKNQAKSERGFRPSLYMKSSDTIAKKAKNQAKSSQVRTRFSPFATQGLHERYNSKNQAKSSKVKASLNEVFALRHT
jgi:hypothetical protein